jgi:hypothetical protein
MTALQDRDTDSARDDEIGLAADEEAFVRRVADAFAPPPRTAAQRVAFQARLEERLEVEGRPRRWVWGLAALAAAALAAVVLPMVFGREVEAPVVQTTIASGSGPAATGAEAAQEDAILAIVVDSEVASDATLPEDYQAIASVFLGG